LQTEADAKQWPGSAPHSILKRLVEPASTHILQSNVRVADARQYQAISRQDSFGSSGY
jgi:hypothetical protein